MTAGIDGSSTGRRSAGTRLDHRRGVELASIDWDGLIAHCCQSLGWSWGTVECEMTLPRLAAFNRYWRRHPPVHVLVAALAGYAAPADRGEGAAGPGELMAWFKATGGRID